MEALPGIGLGNIKGGMKPSEIIQLMDEMDEDEDRSIEYDEGSDQYSLLYKGIRFQFNDTDGRRPSSNSKLLWICINNREDITVFEKSMSFWKRKELIDEVIKRGYEVIYGSGQDIDIQGMGFDFDEKDGKLEWIDIRFID